jgi:FkbM family methyltransferase
MLGIYEALVPKRIRVGVHNRWHAHRSERWQQIKGTSRSLIHRLGNGTRMRLYGDSRLCEMIYFGYFEIETRAFFEAFLRPGDIFLDIGANIGLFTLGAAKIVGNLGRVHSFEPCLQTFNRLLENLELSAVTNAECHQIALGSENGEAELSIAGGGYDAWNSLGTPYMGATATKELVQSMTLESFVQKHALLGRISAVKMDVEGWESHVLAGAASLFSRADAPLLCVEFTEEAAANAGSSCEDLYRMLEGFGYQLFEVGDRSGKLIPFPLRNPFPNVNLIATKDKEFLRNRLAG